MISFELAALLNGWHSGAECCSSFSSGCEQATKAICQTRDRSGCQEGLLVSKTLAMSTGAIVLSEVSGEARETRAVSNEPH